jgi:predicted transcriptional regulator
MSDQQKNYEEAAKEYAVLNIDNEYVYQASVKGFLAGAEHASKESERAFNISGQRINNLITQLAERDQAIKELNAENQQLKLAEEELMEALKTCIDNWQSMSDPIFRENARKLIEP